MRWMCRERASWTKRPTIEKKRPRVLIHAAFKSASETSRRPYHQTPEPLPFPLPEIPIPCSLEPCPKNPDPEQPHALTLLTPNPSPRIPTPSLPHLPKFGETFRVRPAEFFQ